MPSPAQAVSGEQQEVEQDQDQDQSDPLGGGVLHHPVDGPTRDAFRAALDPGSPTKFRQVVVDVIGQQAGVEDEIGKLIGKIATRSTVGVARRSAGEAAGGSSKISRAKSKLKVMAAMGMFGQGSKREKEREKERRWKVLQSAVRRLTSYLSRASMSLKTLFERIDEDHSGSIDCEEFRAGMAQIGLKFDNAAIEEIMEFMKVLPSHPTVLHYM
jgi:hypothetical protein